MTPGAPRFNRKQYGYDPRQVDEYIDKMHEENKRISRVNDELFLMCITELKQIATMGNEMGAKDGGITLERINFLLEQSNYQRQWQRETVPPVERPVAARPPVKVKEKKQKKGKVGSTVFISVLFIIAVLSAYLFGAGEQTGAPRTIFGFAAMTVLTGSMEDEIPQGSLIVTRRVVPYMIQSGNDITFVEGNITITHRVIEVIHNYDDSGSPGFRTWGIANPSPDDRTVRAEDVVGRVIFVNRPLGTAVSFIQANTVIVAIIATITIALIFVLRKFILGDEKGSARIK